MAIDEKDLTRDLSTGFEFRALTPSDATQYLPEDNLKALFISSAGDVTLDDHYGNTDVSFPNMTVGMYLYLRPLRVKAATTATVIGIFK